MLCFVRLSQTLWYQGGQTETVHTPVLQATPPPSPHLRHSQVEHHKEKSN